MKAILTIISILLVCSVFGQTKVLKENFGKYRTHEIYEFKQDTIFDENGVLERVAYNAYIHIIREGIDGQYTFEVTKSVFNDNNKSIEYMATKPEYVDFVIETK
jgi:hypothetical protein